MLSRVILYFRSNLLSRNRLRHTHKSKMAIIISSKDFELLLLLEFQSWILINKSLLYIYIFCFINLIVLIAFNLINLHCMAIIDFLRNAKVWFFFKAFYQVSTSSYQQRHCFCKKMIPELSWYLWKVYCGTQKTIKYNWYCRCIQVGFWLLYRRNHFCNFPALSKARTWIF